MATDPLANLREALQVIRDSKRVIVVPPDMEERAQAVVDALPYAGLFRVVANQHIPAGRIYVMGDW